MNPRIYVDLVNSPDGLTVDDPITHFPKRRDSDNKTGVRECRPSGPDLVGRNITRRRFLAALGGGSILGPCANSAASNAPSVAFPDIRSVPPDLVVPALSHQSPGPGRRVRRTLSAYAHTDVHHTLYLPVDWEPGRKYPVLVEYPGNGPYHSPYGDYSSGEVGGCNMGYGISGGRGFVWMALPFISPADKTNERSWWGDVNATLLYCKNAVVDACEHFGGDSASVIICGFSRGAIACNYIGLHNEEMADIWLAFIANSHYDGVRSWPWKGSDRLSAIERLKLLRGRASFVLQEVSTANIQEYLKRTCVKAPFTFKTILYRNHTSSWILRDIPARRALRAWVSKILTEPPGVYQIRGRVLDADRRPVERVRIQSGDTHWTVTDSKGEFVLRNLIESRRKIVPIRKGLRFSPPQLSVTIKGNNVSHLEFHAS